MNLGQLLSGLIISVLGFVIVCISFFSGFKKGSFIGLIYGIPILIIGVVILMNKKEDYIEPIKLKGGRKK